MSATCGGVRVASLYVPNGRSIPSEHYDRKLEWLARVVRWVKALGLVNCAPGFNQTPAVVNGFTNLIVDLRGPDAGAHARSAIGVAELPLDAPVEIEAIVEVG